MIPPSAPSMTEEVSSLSVLSCSTETSLREIVERQKREAPDTVENVSAEVKRLQAVAPFLEIEKDDRIDALTEELRRNLNVSWTAIGLLDVSRQVLKSVAEAPGMPFGLPNNTLRKKYSFVQQSGRTFQVVTDTWKDDRFHENPYVQHDPSKPYSIRFYASAPIQCNGSFIGNLCVFSHTPKKLTTKETELIQDTAVQVGKLMTTGQSRSQIDGKTRRRSASRDDSEIGRRHSQTDLIKSPSPKRRSASCGPLMFRDTSSEENDELPSACNIIENPSSTPCTPLPDPVSSHADPDEFLEQLLRSMAPHLKFNIQSSHAMDYFPTVTEEQMARYSVNVVSMARNNDLENLKSLFAEQGRDALDCYNRFGEGLLTLACRRGFKDMAEFFLSDEVDLPVRVRDDYGRTPVHDACWNPEPQLEICSWILSKDPSLFLLADKRGFTAFQYARKSDWHIWRQFLFDHRQLLKPLTQPELAKRFEAK